MGKNLLRSIGSSIGRYLAIVAIIALGSSIFVGLLSTKSDMLATGQQYMDAQNMFDLRMVTSFGWNREDVDSIRLMEGVADAEGVFYLDLLASMNGQDDVVYRVYEIPERLNKVSLRGGRMPAAPDECLADGFHVTDDILGKQIQISPENSEDSLDTMLHDTYTVVGYVASPLYIDLNRGNTTIGNGSISSYFYVMPQGIDADYFTEIHVKIPGSYTVYTDAYDDAMEAAVLELEPKLQDLARVRLENLKTEALQQWEDGNKEYEAGLSSYEKVKLSAVHELVDARQQLLDAQRQLDDSQRYIDSAQQQIASGKATLRDKQKELERGKQQLEQTKLTLLDPIERVKNEILVRKGNIEIQINLLQAQIDVIDGKISAILDDYSQQESRVAELSNQIRQLEQQIAGGNLRIYGLNMALDAASLFPAMNQNLIVQLQDQIRGEESKIAVYQQELAPLQAELDLLLAELEQPRSQIRELEALRAPLAAELAVQNGYMAAADASLQAAQASLDMLQSQFAPMEEEIAAGEIQLQDAWSQLYAMEAQLSQGIHQIKEGKIQLEDGWKEYESGIAEANAEFIKAKAELYDGRKKLLDARIAIDKMNDSSAYAFDRNSNAGYGTLLTGSQIVQGVSKIFPAFFLLVASLVCITTMTRMIEDERTQIGTLKAMGYSNSAIISKYLLYSGTASVMGCSIGVLAGSAVFPTILWEAYKIMLHVTPNIRLQINWLLCGIVVVACSAVMLLVTWYCCRRTLTEEPANLIRPKAPAVGKKILLERLRVWQKINFLNKVTIRNIFRYRQRLAMMMVGIGGCTALLVAGFGLRDSIANVVTFQYEEVTLYDMTVYFTEDRNSSQQAAFRQDTEDYASDVLFYHQSSMDLSFDNQTKEIFFMVTDDRIHDFIDFHRGKTELSMPGINQVLLSVGIAETMGIHPGDTIKLRNTDLEILELTVSGLYDNNVSNFAIVTPETIMSQWNRRLPLQMAMLRTLPEQDVYEVSAKIASMTDVMNVSVSEEFMTMVNSMMAALDLIVVAIVICAGLLAVIVLYNLTNINITERIREIATIKVLGFNSAETASYVFKENLALTVMGAILGLVGGKFLLDFIMSNIRIDFIWFQTRILPQSYIYAVILTILSAFFVNLLFYYKLEKINMAEALKSVE